MVSGSETIGTKDNFEDARSHSKKNFFTLVKHGGTRHEAWKGHGLHQEDRIDLGTKIETLKAED